LWEEKDLAAMLKDLTGRGFGRTPEQVRRAAFLFAGMKDINHLWDNDALTAGKNWFSDFLKRNGDIALKKTESLSRTRAQGLNNTEVYDLFIYTEI
jgi:hypothetical protein